MKMKIIGVIPARVESTRLQRKLLLNETGKTLLQHTWENAKKCKTLDEVIVATDSLQILGECQKFGAHFEMTSPDHPNGTSRIAELAGLFPNRLHLENYSDIIVNIQGDEPEIAPEDITSVVDILSADDAAWVSTLQSNAEYDGNEYKSHSVVKVARNTNCEALFFTRQGLRLPRHIGIYGYKLRYLQFYPDLSKSLEQIENLEQMRVLENGFKFVVGESSNAHRGIDTREDYDQFVERWKKQNDIHT